MPLSYVTMLAHLEKSTQNLQQKKRLKGLKMIKDLKSLNTPMTDHTERMPTHKYLHLKYPYLVMYHSCKILHTIYNNKGSKPQKD